MKKLKTINMRAEDEWLLLPSISRANRLRSLSITNVHAAVRGRVVASEQEARAIAGVIVALQGHARSQKLKDKWAEGNLDGHCRPLYLNKPCPSFLFLKTKGF